MYFITIFPELLLIHRNTGFLVFKNKALLTGGVVS